MRPDRRIFNHFNGTSEAHRNTLIAVAAIDPRAWDAGYQLDWAIRAAKDLGSERDPRLEIVPVYDRPGWWTSRPTEYVRVRAAWEAVRRNVSEQDRLVSCHPTNASSAQVLAASAMSLTATRDMLKALLDTLSSDGDAVLERIDQFELNRHR